MPWRNTYSNIPGRYGRLITKPIEIERLQERDRQDSFAVFTAEGTLSPLRRTRRDRTIFRRRPPARRPRTWSRVRRDTPTGPLCWNASTETNKLDGRDRIRIDGRYARPVESIETSPGRHFRCRAAEGPSDQRGLGEHPAARCESSPTNIEKAGKESRMAMAAVFLDKLEKEFLKIRSIFSARG